MSLEESLKAQAESNLELAAASRELAGAMREYAGVMKSIAGANPSQIAAPTQAAAAETTEAPKPTGRGRKPKEDPKQTETATGGDDPFGAEAGGDDPFGEEEAAPAKPAITAETIRELVLKVKDKNKDHAVKLLKAVGAEKVSSIDPKQYDKVVELAAKCGVTL